MRKSINFTDRDYLRVLQNARQSSLSSANWLRLSATDPARAALLIGQSPPTTEREIGTDAPTRRRDIFDEFLANDCVLLPDVRMRTREAFVRYQERCRTAGLTVPIRTNEFVNRLKSVPGILNVKPSNKSYFLGIALRE